MKKNGATKLDWSYCWSRDRGRKVGQNWPYTGHITIRPLYDQLSRCGDGNNYDAITSKIKNYFGKGSVKSILDVDFIFMQINRHNHWYAAVVIRPNLILKGDSGNSG